MTGNNIKDLFICGKCHMNFTDLNLFLTHRSACLVSSSSESNLCVCDLNDMIKDVSSTTNSIGDNTSNEFDLLFSSPVDQIVIDNDLLATHVCDLIKRTANDSLDENQHPSLVECPVCDERFDGETILVNHIFEHSICIDDHQSTWSHPNLSHPQALLQCRQCPITFTSNASLSQHKKLIHCVNPVFRCLHGTCSQLFDKPVDYILHARVHSQKRDRVRRRKQTYRCRICKSLFLSVEQLQDHLNKDQHQFFCQLCSAVFHSNNAYHNHLAQHTETIPMYRCHLCHESFEKRTDLSKHTTAQHQEDLPKQKSCPTCKLTFKTTFHLNRHNVTKHSDIKPYKCEQEGCQQAFARKDKLKQHAVKHSGAGGMFKCQVCLKTFVRPEHLRDHDIVRHSHQFPLRCEYCRKGFLHHSQLYSHHKQHHSNENETKLVLSVTSTDQRTCQHI